MKTENKPEQSEAERFVDFTRKIMSVPKEEIDKRAEEYHKQRIAERKAAAKPEGKKR